MFNPKSILGIVIGLLFFRNIANSTNGGSTVVENSSDEEISSLSFLGRTDLPRGIRNNNPGNLKDFGDPWQGKIPTTDPPFEQFEFYIYGVRAMTKLLQNYILQGDNTINKIINRYAPAGADQSQAVVNSYINSVIANTGFGLDEVLLPDFTTLSKLAPAMAAFENGEPAITPAQMAVAYSLI